MDQELKAYLDEQEARMSQRFDQLGARTDERFKQVETEARHTRVLLEGCHQEARGLVVSHELWHSRRHQPDARATPEVMVNRSFADLPSDRWLPWSPPPAPARSSRCASSARSRKGML